MKLQGEIWLPFLLLALAGGGAVAQSERGVSFQDLGEDGGYSVTINQNYVSGTPIIQVQCVTSRNSTTNITYSILNIEKEYFDIIPDTGLVVLQQDAQSFPMTSTYSATVTCVSQRDIEIGGSAQLRVTYSPENEHTPVFDHNGILEISVPEDRNFTVNPNIVTLNATDDDLGDFGQIFYFILQGNEEGTFSIDRLSGNIFVTTALDYERSMEYWLTVCAGNQQQSCDDSTVHSQTVVHIAVVDIDDEPLKFTQSVYNVTLNETTFESPQDLITLSCFDPDTTMFVVYHKRFQHQPFDIDSNSGTVSATQPLDYEQQQSYSLVFECIEVNSPRNDIAVVNIRLLPINEHRPEQLSNSLRVAFIAIDTAPGMLIASGLPVADVPIKMEFIDRDLDLNLENDTIRYTFSRRTSLVDQHFHLDPETGNLTLTKQFQLSQCPRDEEFLHVFIDITVCDIEESAECPNVQIRLFIPCQPSFPEDLIQIEVSEASATGSILDTIPCDIPGAEGPENRTISIVGNEGTNMTFRVDQNGSLYLQEDLDYEQRQNYTFTLQCRDSRTRKEASATVEVFVLPENDNQPFFRQSVFIFNVTDLESMPRVIGTLQAYDNDLDYGGKLSFSIKSATSPQFSFDEAALILNELPKDPFSDTFVIEVELSDTLYSATATVLVLIDRKDEIRRSEVFSISANSSQGNRNGLYIAIGALAALSLILAVVTVVLTIFTCYYHRSFKELAHKVDTEQDIKMSPLDREGRLGSVHTETCPAYRTTPILSHRYSTPDEQEHPHEAHYHYITTPHLRMDGNVSNNSTSPVRGAPPTTSDHAQDHTPSQPPPPPEATGSRMELEGYVHMQGSSAQGSVSSGSPPPGKPLGKDLDSEAEKGAEQREEGAGQQQEGVGQEGEGEKEEVVGPTPSEYELPKSVNDGAAAKENIYEHIQ